MTYAHIHVTPKSHEGPMSPEEHANRLAAMHAKMTVHHLAAMPHYHPTLAEIWTYPAEELADQIKL